MRARASQPEASSASADGTVCAWRERAELDALLEDGWLLA